MGRKWEGGSDQFRREQGRGCVLTSRKDQHSDSISLVMQGNAMERLTPRVKHLQTGPHYQIIVFWIHTKQNEAKPFMTNTIQLYA